MVSLYLFAAKTTITLSSSTLAFSVGLQGILDRHNHYTGSILLLAGWSFLIFSICLTCYAIKTGMDTLYLFYNNLIDGKPEIDDNTSRKEIRMGFQIVNGFISYIIGVLFMLSFIYINFLAQ
ncbi:MAG: hypothetical protein AAB276_05105 [Pseudomonadota bacterium]